jgi:hypothetical protein
MKRVVLAAALLFCASCGPREVPPQVQQAYSVSALTGEGAFREVEQFVALGPKVPGTEGARKASTHLMERLAALGLKAERDEFMDAVPGGTGTFVNVTATLPGKQPGLVILAAHWDTKSGIDGFMGANDSGSGVGLLLALAPILKAGAGQGPSVMLAFLDGEECRVGYTPHDGLHGSRHLAGRLVASGRAREVRAVIVLDMVGDRNLKVAIPRNGTPGLKSAVFKAAEDGGVREKFSLARMEILDDHQPFLDAGMPAIDLIDFDYGSAQGLNDYWHTPADTLDKLSPASLETVGRVVLRVMNAFVYSASTSFSTAN